MAGAAQNGTAEGGEGARFCGREPVPPECTTTTAKRGTLVMVWLESRHVLRDAHTCCAELP